LQNDEQLWQLVHDLPHDGAETVAATLELLRAKLLADSSPAAAREALQFEALHGLRELCCLSGSIELLMQARLMLCRAGVGLVTSFGC